MSTNTLYLGYHVSSAGGYMAMGKRAAALGANTFAFFTRNPRGGAAAKVEEADVAAFRAWAAEQGFGPARGALALYAQPVQRQALGARLCQTRLYGRSGAHGAHARLLL